MSALRQEVQADILRDRTQTKKGRALTDKRSLPYRVNQVEFIKWLGCEAGFLRGVKLMPKEPPDDLVVTQDWVMLYLHEVYCKEYNYRDKRKLENTFIEGDWWKKELEKWKSKTLPDDTLRTWPKQIAGNGTRIPLGWTGSAKGVLNALQDLQDQQRTDDTY